MNASGGDISPLHSTPMTDDTDELLDKAATLSAMMREHQAAVARIGERRREVIRELRQRKVIFRVIADACNVTDQALYADLRKHP